MSSKAPLVLFCLFAALLAPQAIAFQAADKAPEKEPSPQQEYQALLERVKKSDATVDFGRMRQLQTQLDNYQPYGADPEDHPLAALREGRDAQAQTLAEHVLAMNYLDLESHAAAGALAEKRGDKEAADHHRYVMKGVIDSILKSGDGKSTETAYVVVSIGEEYALMHHLGLRVAGQSLLHDDVGHAYDLLRGVDPEGQGTREVYFQIDALMGALDKRFSE